MSESAPQITALPVDTRDLIPIKGCGASPKDRQCPQCKRFRRVVGDRRHTFHGFLGLGCAVCVKFEQCGCLE